MNLDGLLVVIPARYASTRFPGKALADLGGRTVIDRCYSQVLQVFPRAQIVVATDDDRIADACRALSIDIEMTSDACLTGTDRVAEVAQRRSAEWYVNVQGDEPFLDPEALRALVRSLPAQAADVSVVNAYSPIATEEDFRSVTVPKVVMDQSQRLLYMSRSAIPTTKALEFRGAHRQIGMYAFRGDALARFAAHGAKTPLEQLEDIEILRFVELGLKVQMIEVPSAGIAIDTPDDLERARTYLASLR